VLKVIIKLFYFNVIFTWLGKLVVFPEDSITVFLYVHDTK